MKTIAIGLSHPADASPCTPIYSLELHESGIYTLFDGAAHRSVDQAWARREHMKKMTEGMTARQIAAIIGCSDRAVDAWRRGERSPQAAAIKLMMMHLGLD